MIMKTTFLFAKTQLVRVFRDPVTVIVLFAIPVLLLVLFGAFTKGTEDLKLKVAVVNSSKEAFAGEFAKQLEKVKVIDQPDEKLNLEDAKREMRSGELDGIIELPADFGRLSNGAPTGTARVYFDQTDTTTGDIVSSVMTGVIDENNQQIIGVPMPLAIERISISGSGARIFDGLYAIFTSMAIMMVGIFAVASSIPADKKSGALRRLRVTPLKSSNLVVGTMLAYAVVAILAVILMTVIAILAFGLEMKGSWWDFAGFSLLAIIMFLAFGLMVGGWAKNSTQADIYGQIIFIASLAFSGLWFPRALLPEWLQEVTSYLPLTPVVDGIRSIVTEGAALMSLGMEVMIVVAWMVVVTLVGVKTFRWE